MDECRALSRLQDGTVHLVYGILEEPFQSLEAINVSSLQTGLQRVQLLKPNISIPALPSDVRTMEVRAPDVLVPGRETTYWCHITELPDGFPRHHIVMVRGPSPIPALPPTWGLGGVPPWGAVHGPAGTSDLCGVDPRQGLNFLQPQVCSALPPVTLLTPHPPRAAAPQLPSLDQRQLMY